MKYLISTAFTLLLMTIGYGQKTKFAVKGGLNLSNTRFSVIQNGQELDRSFYGHDKYKNRAAFYLGGSAEFLLKPNKDKTSSIQVELLYSKQGSTYNFSDSKKTFELDQINLPIVLKYPLFNNFFILGGGYLGHVINAQESWSNNDIKHQIEGYHNFDSGLILGLEYKFKFGLFIESRYMYGLSDVSKVEFPDSNIEWVYKNRVFQIGVGYDF